MKHFKTTQLFIRSLLMLACLFMLYSVQAQSTANYTFTSSSTGSLALDANANPIDMSTGTTQLYGPGVDGYTATLQNFGFTFRFMGAAYTQFSANPDGQVRLGSTLITGDIQSAVANAAKIIVLNIDNKTGATGKVHYKVQPGTGGNVLVIEWKDVLINWNAAGTTLSTFQLRLYEATGAIEMVYGQMFNSSTSTQASSIGFSSGITAGAIGQITNIVTTPTYNVTSTSYTTTTFPASSAIANLNSSANGFRKVFTFMPLAGTPATPTSLSFTGVGTTLTTLNWVDNSTTESFFTITRATDAAFTQNVQVSTVASTTLSATGGAYSLNYTNLYPNITYYYNIQAASEAFISGNLTGSQSTVAAAIYTWNSVNGSWTDPNNWTPTRNTTDIADVLQFNNNGLGTSQTATNVPSQTIGRLVVGNGVAASLQAAFSATLTVASDGTPTDELQIEVGSSLLNDGSTAALTISYSGTGSTGNISGDVYVKSVSGSVVNSLNFSSGTNSVTTVTTGGKLYEGQYGGTAAPTISGTTTSLLIAGMYVHHFTTVSGTIPTATWQTGSTCLIDGYTTATTGPSGFAQTFSDVTWDCLAQTSSLSLGGVVPTVNGTFKVVSTGSGDLRVATTTSPTFTVSNFTQTGGVFELNAGVAAGSTVLNVKGSFLHSGGSFCSVSSAGTPMLNFSGTSGTQNVSFNDAAPTAALTYRISNGLGINLVGTGLLTTNFAINNGGGIRVSTKAIAPINTTLNLLYNATGTTLTYDTTASYTMTAVEFPALNGPANLTINVGANNVVTMPSSFVSRALSPTGTNGILTMTSGDIDINSNTLILGASAVQPGTLTYTAGNIRVTTGAFTRYFGTTGLPTTAGAQGGLFPLAFGSFNRNASIYFSSGTALSTGGSLTISHNATTGLTPVAITDGAYTIDNISNGSWTISQSGITASGTIALRLTAGNLISSSNITNLRVTQASSSVGTHVAGTGSFPTFQASRNGLSLAGLAQTHYIGAAASDMGVIANSIASGNWDSPTTWDIGAAPACNSTVYIVNGKTVTVNSTGNQSKDLTIASGANLTIASGDLIVGCTLNNTPFTNSGMLNVTGGTLNINGNMLHTTGTVFNQSGGSINVDGNAAGNATNSVASGTSIVQINTNLLGWTGGVFTIVDPHANSTASNSFAYNTSALNADITSGHTLRFGDGVSNDAGGNTTNGFRINTWVASGRISFFNVEINGSSGTNRFVSTTYTYGVNGNLTINANSEYRDNGVTTYLGGNLSNNGTCITTGTLYIGTYLAGTVTTSTNTQTISGTGDFRNSITTPTANIASLTFDNSNTSGITLSAPLSVSGTLTLTKGIINTSSTNILSLGTATATGTLSGGSNIAYINGPFARTFPSSRTATGTFTVATLFPVGKTTYLPMWVDPSTNSGGAIAITGEAFNANSGTFGTAVTSLSTSRWEALVTTGNINFVSSNIQLGDGTSITSVKKILQAGSASGAYSGIKPAITFTSGTPNTIRTGAQILGADYLGYFAYGDLTPCTVPSYQPTAFVISFLGGTTFTGSFTAATSNPSHYLIVRYPTGSTITNPVDYTSYTVGASLGLGKIVSISAATTFNETGLTAATSYDYYVYAYNNSTCFGPIYNTTTPLTATVTTCLSSVSTPTIVAATKATPTGFIALWRQSSTSGVTYEFDLSTSSTFGSFVSGYQSVSTNTDTFAVIIGLAANTTYYYRVRAIVGGTCYSLNSANGIGKTLCTPISSLPWTENFDGLTTVGATSFPTCWTKENGDWATSNDVTYNSAKSGSNYIRDAFSATNEYMWTPGFQLTAGTSYDFSFFAQGDGFTSWVLDVFYNTDPNSSGATRLGASYSPSGPGSTAIQPYNKVLRRFTAPTSGIYYFALRVNAPLAPWYFAFDDFSLDVSPTCLEPTVLTASSITDVSADISWTASTSAPSSGYGYFISTTNTAPTISTIATGTGLTGTSYSLTGLTANTTYYVWMRSDCGSGDISAWTSTPVIFSTLCTPLTTLPYTENFNSITTPNLPGCTRTENLNNDGGIWATVTAPTTPVGYGGKTLRYNNSTNAANDWFYTTGVTLTGGVSYRLKFNYGNSSTTLVEKLKVMYGTSPISTSMLTLVFDNPAISGNTFRSAQVDFTPPTTGVYYLGFLAYSAASQANLYVDDISLDETPPCMEPTAIAVSSITETTADLTWTAPAMVPGYGYEYYISTSNTAPTLSTIATGSVSSGTTVSLGGLIAGTRYYVWVRGNCGISGTSIWSVGTTFRTTFIVSSLPYTQDFEGTGVNGWSSAVVSGATNDWVIGAPAKTYLNAAHGGSNVWATKLTGTYSPNHNAALISPNFDFSTLTEDPILRFYHSFYMEANYDGGVLEISVNGGAWKRLDSTLGTGTNFSTTNSFAWYNNSSTNLVVGRPAWSGQSSLVFANATTGWQQSAVKLVGAAGKSDVRVRFRFASDGTSNYDGWAIDDIEVVEIATPSIAASSVTVSNIRNTTTDVSWTNGNGNGRLVVARLSTATPVTPTDGKNYRANNVIKAGDSTGLGNYIVYKGSGSTVSVSNLIMLTDYTYDVYEYNGRYMHVKFTYGVSNNATTLPVTLTSFNASAQANDVVIEWNTVSEINNKGFEVERSVDGKVFETIGFVNGAGNSNSKLNYHLTDLNAFDKANSMVLYYRLKQIDFNGKSTYSNITSVSKTELESTQISVFPNPFNTYFNLSVTAKEKGVGEIEIVDVQGRVIVTKSVNCQKGSNSFEIDELANVYHGVYFVRLSLNGEKAITRLVKLD